VNTRVTSYLEMSKGIGADDARLIIIAIGDAEVMYMFLSSFC
jgi:hypothetical protein